MSTVKVGIEITAKALGSVMSAFGSTKKTVEVLGQSIDKAKAKQEKFGRVLGTALSRPGRALGSMFKQYQTLGKAIDRATASQIRLNKAMASQEAGAANRKHLRGQMVDTAGHAAVLGAPIIGAVRTFMRQEDAAVELKMTMMKATGEVGAFNEVLKQSRELGKALPGTTEDFIRLGTALKEQGVTDKRLVGGALRSSANLNIVMGMDQYEGGTFFAKMLEAHNLSEKEFEKAADLTQRAKFAFGIHKSDMYESMKYYASNIQPSGLGGVENYEKIMAIQGIAAQQGMEGSQFGTGFNGLLTRLATGPKMMELATKGMRGEAKAILDQAGVKFDFFDKNRNFKGIDHMVKEMEKLQIIKNKLGDESEKIVRHAIFGEENGRLASLISTAGTKGYERNLELMREQADLNARIAERTSTLSSALEQLGGVAENTFGMFGSVFKDDIKRFATTAMEFIENTLEPWVIENKALILGTVRFVGSLFALKLGFLGVAYAASMIAAPFKFLWVSFARVNALMNTFNIWRLTGGLTRVGKGFTTVAKGAAAFGRAIIFGDLIKGFGMASKAVLAFGRAFMFTPIGLIVAGIAVAALLIYKFWNPIKGYFIGLWEGITEAFKPLMPMFSSLGTTFKPVIDFFKELFSVEQVAEGGARSFGREVGLVVGGVLSTIVTVGSMIIDGWRMIFDAMFRIVGTVWNEISTAFSGGISGVTALIVNWSPIGAFYSAFATVLSWFGIDLPAKFTGFGGMIIDGLMNGLKAKFVELQAWWNEKKTWISDAFAFANRIQSPSRLFMQHGGHIIDGLAIGLKKSAPKAENELKSLSDRLGMNPEGFSGETSGFFGGGVNGGGGGITIHFNPTIHAPGGDENQIQQAMRISLRELEAMLKQLNFDKNRRSA